jgi:hypothetical protein
MTIVPNWGAVKEEREPRKLPLGVLVALTMTASRGDVLIQYLLNESESFHNLRKICLISKKKLSVIAPC